MSTLSIGIVTVLCGPMFGALLIVALLVGPAINFSQLSEKLVMGFVSLLITSIVVAAVLDYLPGIVGHNRVALVVVFSSGLQWGWGRLTTRRSPDTAHARDTSNGLRQYVLLVVPITILMFGVGIKFANRELFRALSMSGDGRNHAVWVADLANHGIRSAIERRYPALFNYALTPFVDACHGRVQSAACVARQAQQAVDAMSAGYFLLAALISLAIGRLSLQLLQRDELRKVTISDALVMVGSGLTPLLGVATQSVLFDGFLPLYASIAAVLLAASLVVQNRAEYPKLLIPVTSGILSLLVLGMFPLLYPAAAAIAFIAIIPERWSEIRRKKGLAIIGAGICLTLIPAVFTICNSEMFQRLRSPGSSTNINRAVFVIPVAILFVLALFPTNFNRRAVLTHLAIFGALVFSAAMILVANRGSGESTPYYYDKVLIAGISLFAWLPVVAVGGIVSATFGRFAIAESRWGKLVAVGAIVGTIAVTYVRTEGSSNQISPVRTLQLGAFSPHPYSIDEIFSQWESGNRYVFWRYSASADGTFDPVEDRMMNFWAPLTWHTDTEVGAFANAWAYSMTAEYTDEYLCSIARQVDNLRIVTRDKSLAQDFSETCQNNNDQIELRVFPSTAS